MNLREARWRDALRIWRWRNHPSTRDKMRNKEPIGLWEHLCWFWRVRHSDVVVQYVAWIEGVPVGSCRLDFSLMPGDLNFLAHVPIRIAEVDVVVAPDKRGQGLGREMIVLLAEAALALGVARVYAVIRKDNRVSLRAFSVAGFVDVPEARRAAEDKYLVLEYRR